MSKIVWAWFNDTDWIPYDEAVAKRVEKGFQSKTKSKSKVRVDPERYVDTKDMLQLRYDDPDRQVCSFCVFV
jgi:hypothetical protein